MTNRDGVVFDLSGDTTDIEFDLDAPVSKVTELVELLQELEAQEAKRLQGHRKWFVPGSPFGIDKMPKHAAFFAAGAKYKERYFSASNRTGKSISGALETTFHATGEYPDWWQGARFDHPVVAYVVGSTKESTRDICQKELIGPPGEVGTGMILPEDIGKVVLRPNSGGAVDFVQVRHKSGGWSRVHFKSYEQGTKLFEGTSVHVVWMDELPPADIFSEAYLRTMTTQGIIYVTATPLAGLTELVLSFYTQADFLPIGTETPGIVRLAQDDEEERIKAKIQSGEMDILDHERWKASQGITKSKAVIIAGWDDAPWLDEDSKKRMLEATPVHLRVARSTGLPSMGSGSVFTTPLESILVPDFPIPAHWKKVCGMDVGWNNTAGIWLAGNPDTNEWYVYSEYKRGQAEPLVHAAAFKMRGDWIPTAIDPASRGRSQVDGKQLFNMYRQLGIKVFPADNAREASLYALQEAFATGQLKICKSCTELCKEYVTYRRDEKGRVIKENDHEIDALRYAYQSRKFAKQRPITRSIGPKGSTGKAYDI